MKRDKYPYRILIIEDNPGDVLLVEDYLDEHILTPHFSYARSYSEAKEILSNPKIQVFDIILLDLTLPDKSGEDLIESMNSFTHEEPIIVLTGYSDLDFAMKSLSMGISDYLIKENINSSMLYKSVVYNIERFKFVKDIKASQQKYSDLFQLSPIPMFLYDFETLKFLDVNNAAVRHYGYSRNEFLNLTVKDLHPKEELPAVDEAMKLSEDKEEFYFQGVFSHLKKSGEMIQVDIRSNIVYDKGKKAEIALAHDITERLNHIKTIEKQNKKLKEIAWMQSHVVRAPLARMMGLINVLKSEELSDKETMEYLSYVMESALELDDIIRDVVDKSQEIMHLAELNINQPDQTSD